MEDLKFVKRLFFISLIIFLAAWLIPNLPWRPKRLEDYLKIYRMIFEAFRTWSMVSTAFTTLTIFLYFTITGAYNRRRQYTKSTRDQKEELIEDVSENERLWEEIRSKKIRGKRKESVLELKTRNDMKAFLEEVKVFEYLEGESLNKVLECAVLKSVRQGEKLVVNKTDLVFVTLGSFRAVFHDNLSICVTCRRGKTLTSYSNVMRALAYYYNKTDGDKRKDLVSSINLTADEDSQVLILNEECFVGLARVSKLSVAHLTQVILSRFKRATIPIVFDYFNLTGFAASFLGYFIKKSNGFIDVKLTELLNCFQETLRAEERLLKVIFQYLIGSFELEHVAFGPMETSLSLLQSHIQIKTCDQEEIIQEIGGECKGAFLVLEGKLRVSFSGEEDAKFIEASVGDFVGIISSLMGKCSSIQVKCSGNTTKSGVTYAVISQHLLEMISERDPKILFANIPDNRNTSQFIEFLDMCIDWQQLGSGETVDTDRVIIKILHGRVREFKGQVLQERHQRELGSGSFLGEQGIFAKTHGTNDKTFNFYTVRQTEIASWPLDLIEGLVTANSEVSSALLPKLLARQKEDEQSAVDPIKTICLLPIGVDKSRTGATQKLTRDNQTRLTEGVAEYLQRTLKRHQTTFTVIDGVRANELMGRQLFITLGTLKMNEFLSSQEDVSKLIIYVADGIFSNWTKQCISQADLVLLIADLDEEVVEFGDLERQMLQMNPLINVEICLLSLRNHHNRLDSRKWIKHRPWLKAHYHLIIPGSYSQQLPLTMNNNNANILNMIPMDLFNNILIKSRDLLGKRVVKNQRRGSIFMTVEREDEIEVFGFGRLGRRILGRSIGLVLGGGGARGLAHLGIFKALKEAGIQVDLIGGTSIGAFIGGLLAKEGGENYSRVLLSVESFCKAVGSKWRQALDLTYPATSWFTGHAFNRAIWKHFGFAGIEDFSVPFFAVTTDLTRSRLQLHRTGPAWKYIRASMSLSGFLPPVCDARDGTLLLDGGYLANVPIELMLNGSLTELSELTVKNELSEERRDALVASIVLAVDVGRTSDRVPIFYGDSLNGWTVIVKKIIKFFKQDTFSTVNLPLTLDEIQFRLAYASSAGLLSRTLKRSHVQLAKDFGFSSFVTVEKENCQLPQVIYLRPSGVQQYGTLEFKKYPEIIKVGYDYGKRIIEEWRDSGLLEKLLKYQGTNVTDVVNETRSNESDIVRCRRSSI